MAVVTTGEAGDRGLLVNIRLVGDSTPLLLHLSDIRLFRLMDKKNSLFVGHSWCKHFHLLLPAGEVDHGPGGVGAGVAGEPPLGEVVDPVDDRVDAAVQDGRQVKDVFHNHWNLGKRALSWMQHLEVLDKIWYKLMMALVLRYLFGVAVAKYTVDGVPGEWILDFLSDIRPSPCANDGVGSPA